MDVCKTVAFGGAGDVDRQWYDATDEVTDAAISGGRVAILVRMLKADNLLCGWLLRLVLPEEWRYDCY
jgi:hypothetical protein